ncbi:hypothetical protein D3C87_279680 [compost metagenome]
MKKILQLLQAFFNMFFPLQLAVDDKQFVQTSAMKPKFTEAQILVNDQRNFWEDLPLLSDDPAEQERLVTMIRKRFPATEICDPTYNRKKNYMSLYYLRNESKKDWVFQDVKKRLPGDNRSILEKELRPAVHLA